MEHWDLFVPGKDVIMVIMSSPDLVRTICIEEGCARAAIDNLDWSQLPRAYQRRKDEVAPALQLASDQFCTMHGGGYCIELLAEFAIKHSDPTKTTDDRMCTTGCFEFFGYFSFSIYLPFDPKLKRASKIMGSTLRFARISHRFRHSFLLIKNWLAIVEIGHDPLAKRKKNAEE